MCDLISVSIVVSFFSLIAVLAYKADKRRSDSYKGYMDRFKRGKS